MIYRTANQKTINHEWSCLSTGPTKWCFPKDIKIKHNYGPSTITISQYKSVSYVPIYGMMTRCLTTYDHLYVYIYIYISIIYIAYIIYLHITGICGPNCTFLPDDQSLLPSRRNACDVTKATKTCWAPHDRWDEWRTRWPEQHHRGHRVIHLRCRKTY